MLKRMGPLVCIAAAVQLLRRNRPDLLNPAAPGPTQTETHPNEAPVEEIIINEIITGESAPGPSTEHPPPLPVPAPRTLATTKLPPSPAKDTVMEDIDEFLESDPIPPPPLSRNEDSSLTFSPRRLCFLSNPATNTTPPATGTRDQTLEEGRM
ncbi:unnamed protein product [Ixodes hexagonus]